MLQRYPAHQHYSKDIHVVENMPCEIKRYLQRLYHEFTHDGERILDWHQSVRQIKFVPMFGFPALTWLVYASVDTCCCACPVFRLHHLEYRFFI